MGHNLSLSHREVIRGHFAESLSSGTCLVVQFVSIIAVLACSVWRLPAPGLLDSFRSLDGPGASGSAQMAWPERRQGTCGRRSLRNLEAFPAFRLFPARF